MKLVKRMDAFLAKLVNGLADIIGKPTVFALAFILVALWFCTRFFLEYEAWFDIMDVFIFITTFFLLFVVQASQNADTKAIQDKLDNIIDALPGASKDVEGEEERIKAGKKNSR